MLVHRLRHAFISDYQKDTTFFIFLCWGHSEFKLIKKLKYSYCFLKENSEDKDALMNSDLSINWLFSGHCTITVPKHPNPLL